MRRIILLMLALSIAQTAPAQSGFPSRPIKIVVPFAASGGAADQTARFFGNKLTEELGQPVIIENRPGGSGIVAITSAKNAPADGYTLLMVGTSPLVLNAIVVKDLAYDPVKDLRPVSGAIKAHSVIIVGEKSPHVNLADFIKASKAARQPVKGGFSGVHQYLFSARLANAADFKFLNVPYTGAATTLTGLIAGDLDFAILDLTAASALMKAGKVRGLAVTGQERSWNFPETPTFPQAGYPEAAGYGWNSFYVTAPTPDEVVAVLARAMQKILGTKAAEEFARSAGVELMPLGPEALRKFQLEEIAIFKRVASSVGLEPQ